MMRYRILLSAVIMQMCLGATYSWSVYVQPIKALTGLLQGPAQIPFTVFYFVFPAMMMVSGKILDRLGPRICAVTGGVIFGFGWMTASLGSIHFGLTVAGVGILGGIGVGLAYIVPIAVGIRWFPKNKGLVTGVAVAGFGGGAALVSQIGAGLMNRYEFTPFHVLGIMGSAFLILIVLAGSQMKNPHEDITVQSDSIRISEFVFQTPFRVLYVAMFTGLAAGFAVNANLKELVHTQSLHAGVAAVSTFALANAVGRVFWGWLCDHISPSVAIRWNLLLQTAVLLCAPLILGLGKGLVIFAFLTGLNYGGVLVIYAASTASLWGAQHVGRIYGLIFSANIPAALSPILAGMVFDHAGTFTPALTTLAILMAAAAVYVWKNNKRLKVED
jgi:OFA family oxalate/formate antiporter-like MFS transporter